VSGGLRKNLMKPTSNPHDIYIIGNIASGKTTLGKLLGEQFGNSIFVPEPHDKNPFLPLYLGEQKRWGFTSTLFYYLGYAEALAESTSEKLIHYNFIDAGTWINAFVYARYMLAEGVINADEYDFYEKMRLIIDKAYPRCQPAAFIFVHASPVLCNERMQKRGWEYQSPVTAGYIEILHGYIGKMEETILKMGVPVMDISSEQIDFTCPEGALEAIGQVEGFIRQQGIQ
jgi:deoxyadenosine/deoxycytidine kinase